MTEKILMDIKKENVFWLLQGIIFGAISAYFLVWFFLYFGILLLIVFSITAMLIRIKSIKLRLLGFIIGSVISTVISILFFVYVPGGADHNNAINVGHYIETKYGKFDKRILVERTHSGKIFYNLPGKYPTIIFYEVVEPKDIQDIERYAKESLNEFGISKVKLVFYKKQNWHGEPEKAGFRGIESAFKKIEVVK